MLQTLRSTILQVAPHIDESIKYAIPFYSYYGPLCFLNVRRDVVTLGLCRGACLADEQGILEGRGKEVRHVHIRNMLDINITALQVLLQEAALLNEVSRKTKKYKKWPS